MSDDKFKGNKNFIVLSEKDFNGTRPFELKRKNCCIVVFYSPTCPHCLNMQDEFIKFASMCKFMDVCIYNTRENLAHYERIRNDMPNLIQGVPTFIFYSNGKPIEHYKGNRTTESFLNESMRVCKNNS